MDFILLFNTFKHFVIIEKEQKYLFSFIDALSAHLGVLSCDPVLRNQQQMSAIKIVHEMKSGLLMMLSDSSFREANKMILKFIKKYQIENRTMFIGRFTCRIYDNGLKNIFSNDITRAIVESDDSVIFEIYEEMFFENLYNRINCKRETHRLKKFASNNKDIIDMNKFERYMAKKENGLSKCI